MSSPTGASQASHRRERSLAQEAPVLISIARKCVGQFCGHDASLKSWSASSTKSGLGQEGRPAFAGVRLHRRSRRVAASGAHRPRDFLGLFARHHRRLALDDSMYLSHNPLLAQPDHLWKVWFRRRFHRVLSARADHPVDPMAALGDNTFPYHLTNVLLHIANALLLWRLLPSWA